MALQLEPILKKGPPCTVGVALRQCDADDRAVLQGWLDDPSITHARLARSILLSELGRVAPESVRRHRAKDCLCGTD